MCSVLSSQGHRSVGFPEAEKDDEEEEGRCDVIVFTPFVDLHGNPSSESGFIIIYLLAYIPTELGSCLDGCSRGFGERARVY